ncbi:phosphocarrier protein [Halanaerobium congolense]|jgi:phosphocarrier protein|uniref:Phosphocarrier protein n=1 Tax=Halanaerobium congolense TaxID=54121 RepID=A0A1I0AJZ0_9FIRM|nr:HPr family phosphocarrier protein [Halanaerobium congolense]PTX17451.1 phosphocarrier protein [Halanaerobium congolense]SDF44858.1 phosphocarrier protein [Halanaerobium congolense]SES93981.1 phosphocarrier protein [Halanaerobium congolense]SFP24769.1 phosphocarrier protein [Halanaerobium congolense]
MKKADFILEHEEGFHARPAGIFSKQASKFKADIVLFKNGNQEKEYNPKSIISIMTMGATQNDKITIQADGNDEEEAVNSLLDLVANDFKLAKS